MNWWRCLVKMVLRAVKVRPRFRRAERTTSRGECNGVPFRVDSFVEKPPQIPAEVPPAAPAVLGEVLARALKGRASAASVVIGGGGVHLVTVGQPAVRDHQR